MPRRLIVGDIHGCFDEFQALLDAACLATDDEIIALGDFVDRGPATPQVLDFFRSGPNARSVMGNHERKHVRSYQDRVFCIDTGCCHGKALTGLLLPEFRLISVPSRKDYWAEVSGAYFAANPQLMRNRKKVATELATGKFYKNGKNLGNAIKPNRIRAKKWSERRESNPRQLPWQGSALPTELRSLP